MDPWHSDLIMFFVAVNKEGAHNRSYNQTHKASFQSPARDRRHRYLK